MFCPLKFEFLCFSTGLGGRFSLILISLLSGATVIVRVNGADNQLILKNNYKFDGNFRFHSQPNTSQKKICP
jgi:hypothetical protein